MYPPNLLIVVFFVKVGQNGSAETRVPPQEALEGGGRQTTGFALRGFAAVAAGVNRAGQDGEVKVRQSLGGGGEVVHHFGGLEGRGGEGRGGEGKGSSAEWSFLIRKGLYSDADLLKSHCCTLHEYG